MTEFELFFREREFKWELGLERVRGAVGEFGGKDYPSIIVAGTNGKGTTALLTAEALLRQGFKVGLFTSPHVYRFNERIKVNLKEVEDGELNRAFREIRPLVEKYNLSYFEASLLLALEVFKRERVECGVFEVGLGGRLDATNALDHQVAVLTKVSLDHRDYLGSSLREIASEKVAVFKGKVVGVSLESSPEVLEVLRKEFKGELHLYGKDFWAEEPKLSLRGTDFYYMGQIPVSLRLVGSHYCENASCAVRASQILTERFLGKRFLIPKEFTSTLPGRFELLREEPPFIFDGAHNGQALRSLFKTLKELSIKADIIFGAFRDKELSDNLKEVREYLNWSGGELFTVSLPPPRGLSKEELVEIARKLGLSAKPLSRVKISQFKRPAVLTGSFYLGGLVERG
ncbi:bifunctional folylpolyglutamate synthase/dihydrofolate synthase [Thermovibrio sp.]